ncbi:MAG: asparagine synthase (glutamine-hydrolyzing) [Ferrovibrio sp.]|uniref:asparagine synthase (glutamine-hydrolyzing) n=1 Tax=Ferrovibrio sp. TaxID=1917215 RepID=UPI00263344CC|nr:asparagine synthase (glutamine-hydrolyzing) [Ferrovibrio sp.]MCW0234572.1 asparagine synthase (glutamine-hydrolyzing) [Ferrovibrio sp.]
MCGIAGWIGNGPQFEQMSYMLDQMGHRGPDGRDQWSDRDAGVVLGHLRLAIIDLNTGNQPMISPDGRYVIVYNGEIYNYLELRPQLEARGWVFRTTSDTEVLLAGLAQEGPDFFHKTIGMFALALWDRMERKLLLARDRMGIKPLYIAETAHGIAFASELKSLLRLPGVSREIDPAALESYLTLRYVPSPATMVKGIRKFPAAHYGWVQSGRLSMTRWWDIDFNSRSGDITPMEAEQLDWHLQDAVRLCLRSDVPYGAFLSGGVDSGVVVGLMARESAVPVRTYSIGFSGIADERQSAASVARAIGTSHQELELAPQDLMRLPETIRLVDEPFPDPIILAMSSLAERARRDVKVILTGEGADELFGGYVHHKQMMQLSAIAPYVPQACLNLAARMAQRVPMRLLDRLFDYPVPPGPEARERLAKLLRAARSPAGRYLAFVSLFDEEDRERLLQEAGHDEGVRRVRDELTGSKNSAIDQLWRFEHKAWLVDNILLKQDKTLMAHSVEGRVPFCDHRLVELAARLPLSARLGPGAGKSALRDAARRLVPELPPSGPKHAFMIPQEGAYAAVIRDLAGDSLGSQRFRELGLFRRQAIDTLLTKLTKPSLLPSKQVLALTMFAIWEREVLASRGAEAAAA